MKIKSVFSVSILLSFLLTFSVLFTVSAVNENAVEKFYSYNQKLLCISYRGDTEFYPPNSIAAITSALNKGADFVSVSLDKTNDGVFYLCEKESIGNICNAPYENLADINSQYVADYNLLDIYGNLTEYKLNSLTELIESTDGGDGIILDIMPEDKDAVYEVLHSYKALDRFIIRVEESAAKLAEWKNSKQNNVNIISVYSGNIIFNTVSSINAATKDKLTGVNYVSKNYFNVAYGDFFTNRYLTTENARAIASTYSLDLCGQRGDGTATWNELIKKGYSVIETNNIEAFGIYREETEELAQKIAELTEKAFYVDIAGYSEVSISNLRSASLNGEILASGIVFSLDEAQKVYSELIYALNDMKISTGEVDTRGALNITAGKIVAAVLVGAALLSGQIYVYKMRKNPKEKQ